MNKSPIFDSASRYGLTIETVLVPQNENAYRVLKGVNQIFIGTEAAVQEFLKTYENDRPGLMDMSMYGYRE